MLWEPRREDHRQIAHLSNRIRRMQVEGWKIRVVDRGDSFIIESADSVKIKRFKYKPQDPRGVSKIDARKDVIDFLKLLESSAPDRPNGYWPTEIHIDEIAVMDEEGWEQEEEEETPGQRALRELTRRKLEDPMATLTEAFGPLDSTWDVEDLISDYGFVRVGVLSHAGIKFGHGTNRTIVKIDPDGEISGEAVDRLIERIEGNIRAKRWWKRKR